jgi:hypothetical protein
MAIVVAVVENHHLVPNPEFPSSTEKKLVEIQEAAQAHTSLEAISTVAIDWPISGLSVKPGWSGMRSVHDLT